MTLFQASLLCFSAGTIDTWLLWNLTGGTQGGIFVTDATNAARTNLMNIHKMQWDEQTLHQFSVQRSMLPDIKSNAEVYGKVKSGGLAGKNHLSAQHTLQNSALLMLAQLCTFASLCLSTLNPSSSGTWVQGVCSR